MLCAFHGIIAYKTQLTWSNAVQQGTSKRKYNRLTPTTWAEIRAHWETGEVTLQELSHQHGISTRTLQAHFEKAGTVKGSAAAALAAAVKQKVLAEELPDVDVTAARAKDTR